MGNRSDPMAVRVAVFYAIFAGLWILLSDRVLALFMTSFEMITQWQTYKGGVFVAVTAVLLYLERRRSERRLLESEKKFRTLAETVPCVILLYHDDGVSYMNPSVEALTGYTRNELESMNFWELCHPDFREMVRTSMMSKKEGSDIAARYEFKIIRKDGEERWLDFTQGLLDVGGKRAALGTAFDITQRKRAEEQITRALKEKEVLLKEVHHRVKNNLQVVSSLLNLQAKRVKNKGILDMFIESQNRVKSMALIHERLYRSEDLARIDFGEYVRSLSDGLMQGYDIPNVTVSVNIGNVFFGVDMAIPCGLIINELVSNSLKHGFIEGRAGHIGVEISQPAQDIYRLMVSDNGRGIPDSITLPHVESLGLQLVVSLTEQLHGVIRIVREQGTSFILDFPSHGQVSS